MRCAEGDAPDLRTASGRLRLRRPTTHDLDDVHRLHADPRTNVHNPAGPDADRATSAARLEQWIDHWREHGFGYWVVETAAPEPEVVGVSGVRHETWLGRPVLNLYYRFGADHWRRGYAGEVARHAVAWARAEHPDLPVLAYTTLENSASQRTAEVAGLVRRTDLEHELNGLHAVVLVSHWPQDR